MDDFQYVLMDCGLCDMGYQGPKSTWCNHISYDTFTIKRLDRTLANQEWLTSFGRATGKALPNSVSDHHPILNCVQSLVCYRILRGRYGDMKLAGTWMIVAN
ncbi:hypothetical protein I3843_03G262500 [Carya illinoinensis]|nr:hypothetical protein I3760_03G275200 [Carya illinoinensis]KAG7989938.1 hypothetical protein I3843_03G262500 [Carya illinoinensis]